MNPTLPDSTQFETYSVQIFTPLAFALLGLTVLLFLLAAGLWSRSRGSKSETGEPGAVEPRLRAAAYGVYGIAVLSLTVSLALPAAIQQEREIAYGESLATQASEELGVPVSSEDVSVIGGLRTAYILVDGEGAIQEYQIDTSTGKIVSAEETEQIARP